MIVAQEHLKKYSASEIYRILYRILYRISCILLWPPDLRKNGLKRVSSG